MSRDSVSSKMRNEKRDFLHSVRFILAAVVAGALLGTATVGFIYLLVFGYYVLTPEVIESQRAARELAIGWAPSLFFVLGASVLAFKVGYKCRQYGVSLGLLVGLSAATVEQLIVLFEYPPVLPNELLSYVIFGMCGGAVGGWFSVLEVARAETGEKALFDETINIARAGNADQVAEAIGALVGRDRVAVVGLWKDSPFSEHSEEKPTGIWEAGDHETFPVAMLLGVTGRRTRDRDTAQNLLAETLNREARRAWSDAGVRSAFAGPMIYMGGESLGFLFVGFRKTTLVTGASRRRLLAAAAAAGLALEKLASLEKQRQQDRKLGVMEERERVSREIHDSLVQYLGSIAGELDASVMAAEAGNAEMAPRHLDRARDAARLATVETRRLMRALRPEILDGFSLQEALTALARRFSEESGIMTTLNTTSDVLPLSPETEHALTRITQEALSNVRKHSGATRVVVSLEFEDEFITLGVTDDGVGMEDGALSNGATSVNGGFGVRSMRERVERIGGHFRVESSACMGTKVVVEAPVHNGHTGG